MNTVGIDFGTTKTLVATMRDGRPECIALGRIGYEIPTTLHVDANGEILIGDDADDQMVLDPGGYVRRMKRDLGTGKQHHLHGVSFSTVKLVSKFLADLKQRIETECLHGSIDHAVITHPAKFSPSAISDLREAITKAGYSSFDLVEEPVAAGIAFLEEKKGTELGESILVFDWGGGTLDIALVESRSGELHINHDKLEGETKLGGEDIDDALLDAFNAACSEQRGIPPIELWNTETYRKVHNSLVQMKEFLSKKVEYSFTHVLFDEKVPFGCSRQDFEQIIEPLTDKALACFLRWQDSTNDSTTPVLLVGGTSQMPIVARLLEANDQKVLPWNNSKRAVALGAAIKANLSAQPSGGLMHSNDLEIFHELTVEDVAAGYTFVDVPTNNGKKRWCRVTLSADKRVRLKGVLKLEDGDHVNGDVYVTFKGPPKRETQEGTEQEEQENRERSYSNFLQSQSIGSLITEERFRFVIKLREELGISRSCANRIEWRIVGRPLEELFARKSVERDSGQKEETNPQFYYLDSARQPVGPLDLHSMRRLQDQGAIVPTTLISQIGGTDWVPVSTVLGNELPPIPVDFPHNGPSARQPIRPSNPSQRSQGNTDLRDTIDRNLGLGGDRKKGSENTFAIIIMAAVVILYLFAVSFLFGINWFFGLIALIGGFSSLPALWKKLKS